jgi:hypothetical protein
VGKGLRREIEQEEKRGGPTVIRTKKRYQNLDLYRVKYSKPALISHFKSIIN